jgi:hypothetical protein
MPSCTNRARRRCMPRSLSTAKEKNLAMPKAETLRRSQRAAHEGKSPSTQAGEFVREEIESIRRGEHGARSTRQAIAIGLSKARRAGVSLPPPAKGKTSATVRHKARQDLTAGKKRTRPSRKRSRATLRALQREPRSAASHEALSRQARSAAKKRSRADRSRQAKRAAATRRRRQAKA